MKLADLYKEFLAKSEGDAARPQGIPLFTKLLALVLGWIMLLRLPTITARQREDAEKSAFSSVRLLLLGYSDLLSTHADIAEGLQLTPEMMEDLLRRDLEYPKLIANARGLLKTVQAENRRLDSEIAHYNARLEKAVESAQKDGALPQDERQQLVADSRELERLAQKKQQQLDTKKKGKANSEKKYQKQLQQIEARRNLTEIAAGLLRTARKRLGPGSET
jgi:hypothetical protein